MHGPFLFGVGYRAARLRNSFKQLPSQREKLLRTPVLRILEHGLCRSLFFDAPGVKEAHAIGKFAGKPHLVGDHEHGQVVFGGEVADDSEHFAANSGSSADVTSSNNMTFGRIARARAIATRCRCPPESWEG